MTWCHKNNCLLGSYLWLQSTECGKTANWSKPILSKGVCVSFFFLILFFLNEEVGEPKGRP